MRDKEDMQRLVDELGDVGPDGIATLFEGHGFKGVPCDPAVCPVSRWIRKTGEADWASAGAFSGSYGTYQGNHVGPLRFPDSVTEFISRFDNRLYPNLIEERIES